MCAIWFNLLFDPTRWRSPFCNDLRLRLLRIPAPLRHSTLKTPIQITNMFTHIHKFPPADLTPFRNVRVTDVYKLTYMPLPRPISESWHIPIPSHFWQRLWNPRFPEHSCSTFYLIIWKALPCAEYFAHRFNSGEATHPNCLFCNDPTSVAGPSHWFGWSSPKCTHVTQNIPNIQQLIDWIAGRSIHSAEHLKQIHSIVCEHRILFQRLNKQPRKRSVETTATEPPKRAAPSPSTPKRSTSSPTSTAKRPKQ
jgi:hypothetical protein